MRSIATLLLCTSISLGAAAQTTITNGGFENWENVGSSTEEPTDWNSNKTGSSLAATGPQTCSRDNTIFHSGSYSVLVETKSGPFSTVVNGNVTTGVVNAPSINKADGYIGTINYTTASDQRRMAFTGRPDSVVGWYRYTSGGGAEQAKIRVILHTGDYYDPETPTTYHPDLTANKIGDGVFLGAASTVGSWTRFAIPITYVSSSAPTHIMISMTSSANQLTTVVGSKFWVDDLEAVYTPTVACSTPTGLAASSVTTSSATLNWTSTGALGAQYVLNGLASAPTGSGTFISGTTYNATMLTTNTTYYFHLRDTCAGGLVSPWTQTMFTTGPVSVNNVNATDFAITSFPNPAKNEVTVNINGQIGEGAQVQLMDISGRVLATQVVAGATVNISMSDLPAGLYVIRYADAEHIQTIKINKQ